MDVDPNLFDTLAVWLRSVWWTLRRLRRKLFRIHFHKNVKMVVLFGVPFLNNVAKPPTRFPVQIIK